VPGPLVTAKDISAAAVTTQKRDFDTKLGKIREVRVFYSFTTADVDVSMPHALGRKPTTFSVVASGATSGGAVAAPGKIYLRDPSFWATKNVATLVSDTALSWAEVILR
jgi:hypothetical protein